MAVVLAEATAVEGLCRAFAVVDTGEFVDVTAAGVALSLDSTNDEAAAVILVGGINDSSLLDGVGGRGFVVVLLDGRGRALRGRYDFT